MFLNSKFTLKTNLDIYIYIYNEVVSIDVCLYMLSWWFLYFKPHFVQGTYKLHMITLHLIKHNNSSRKPIVKVLQVSIIKHSFIDTSNQIPTETGGWTRHQPDQILPDSHRCRPWFLLWIRVGRSWIRGSPECFCEGK